MAVAVDLIVHIEAADRHVWDGGASVVARGDSVPLVIGMNARRYGDCLLIGTGSFVKVVRRESYFVAISCCKATGPKTTEGDNRRKSCHACESRNPVVADQSPLVPLWQRGMNRNGEGLRPSPRLTGGAASSCDKGFAVAPGVD